MTYFSTEFGPPMAQNDIYYIHIPFLHNKVISSAINLSEIYSWRGRPRASWWRWVFCRWHPKWCCYWLQAMPDVFPAKAYEQKKVGNWLAASLPCLDEFGQKLNHFSISAIVYHNRPRECNKEKSKNFALKQLSSRQRESRQKGQRQPGPPRPLSSGC